MKILILDLCCPFPYDPEVLRTRACGGTEASVVRVAEELGKEHEVYVAQTGRTEEFRGSAVYGPLVEEGVFGVVVVLRDVRGLPFVQAKFSSSRHFLWMHDENYQALAEHIELLRDVTILGVSNYHKHRIIGTLMAKDPDNEIEVDFVYNPVVVPNSLSLARSREPTLLFFSSPHKGLKHTLETFRAVKSELLSYGLLVANPGYMKLEEIKQDGVTILGELTHAAVLEQVSKAFAILHCNTDFPETFGLVHAEGNALGTPVITSTLGANREILTNFREQCVNIKSPEAIIRQIKKWEKSYPVITGKPEFKIENVMQKWQKVLR